MGKERSFLIAATIAVVARIVGFVILLFSPFPLGDSATAPLSLQTGFDYSWYAWAANIYFQDPGSVLDQTLAFFTSGHCVGECDFELLLSHPSAIFPGPVFPALLYLFEYQDGNTLGLSLIYLVLGSILAVIWLRWMHARRVDLPWLILFALLPHELFFTYVVSSDLLYALMVAGFFFFYVFAEARDERLWPMFAVLLLAVLTRPHSISLLLVFFCDVLIVRRHIIFERPLLLVMVALLGLAAAVFYLPYFVAHMIDTSNKAESLYGMPAGLYLLGLPDTVSGLFGYLSDILIMIVLKILKLMGLHGSNSGIVAAVGIRGVFGVIFLLGFVSSLLRGSASVRMLIFFTILPMLLGHPGWRYMLPIFPLLFYYGVEALNGLMTAARQRKRHLKTSA